MIIQEFLSLLIFNFIINILLIISRSLSNPFIVCYKPYSGHRRGHRYLPLCMCRHGGESRDNKVHSVVFASSLKKAPHQPPIRLSFAPNQRSVVRRSERRRRRYLKIHLRRYAAAGGWGWQDRGVARMGRWRRRGRVAGTRGSCRRGVEKGGGRSYESAESHASPSYPASSATGGRWVNGWIAPAPRTDQYLKHREVSSRYFRCPSAAGNEGVKNILQIARAGIISSPVQVPSIVDEGTDPLARHFARDVRQVMQCQLA